MYVGFFFLLVVVVLTVFSFFHPVKCSESFCSYVGVMKNFGGYGGGKLGGGG